MILLASYSFQEGSRGTDQEDPLHPVDKKVRRDIQHEGILSDSTLYLHPITQVYRKVRNSTPKT